MQQYGSNYWLRSRFSYGESLSSMKSVDYQNLVSVKKAVSNYAKIITGKPIRVTYNGNSNSYTDGQEIVIGSNVSTKDDIDVAVGLALHESAHIKYTDFDIFSKINFSKAILDAYPVDADTRREYYSLLKMMLNLVEDLRIDAIMYRDASGYRDYYVALYNKYFYNKDIDAALKSDSYTDESIESYVFRLINIRNDNSDLSKLKGLREIWNILDLDNILRLESVYDSFDVAFKIFKVIIDNVSKNTNQESGSSDSNCGDSEDGGNEDNVSGGGDGANDKESRNKSDNNTENSDGNAKSHGTSGEVDDVEAHDTASADGDARYTNTANNRSKPLSYVIKNQVDKIIAEQCKYIDGSVTKSNLDEQLDKMIDGFIEHNVTFNKRDIDGLARKDYSEMILISNDIDVMSRMAYIEIRDDIDVDRIYSEGVLFGKGLAKKLEVRNIDRETTYNRLDSGKIDKRRLSALGYGNKNVFKRSVVDSYDTASIHISLDYSRSMTGIKWDDSVKFCIGMMYAATVVKNIDVSVSIRSSVSTRFTNKNLFPMTIITFDPSCHSFKASAMCLSKLRPTYTTPESLCYPSALDYIKSRKSKDNYFITLTDGMPDFSGFDTNDMIEHAKKQMQDMKLSNIKALAYFLTESTSPSPMELNAFNRSYGSAGHILRIEDINSISKTMNKFLVKSS